MKCYVAVSTLSWGELFLFWNLYHAPVLHPLMTREVAAILENVSDDVIMDRLCGLVVRVFGYRSGGLGSIPGTTKKKKK
jgi:hypothetical protein